MPEEEIAVKNNSGKKGSGMPTKLFFGKASLVAVLLVALCASLSLARENGGDPGYDNHVGRGGWGGYRSWYGGWGLGAYWQYPYDYGCDYPYAGHYYSYAPSIDGGGSAAVNPVAAAPWELAAASDTVPTSATDSTNGRQGVGEARPFCAEARAAFLHDDYQDALRLATHASVDEPRNPKVHELISLALFALGNSGPAAGEAHAAMSLGTVADGKDLFGYYHDASKHTAQSVALEVEKYKTQLLALEMASAGNPRSAAEHFLLGYHFLMNGARDNAEARFAQAVKLTPGDKLASHYLQRLQSNSPLTPPMVASRPSGKAR